MGQQQLLLIVLGVIIVGIAIVAGIGLFNAGAEEAAKDELAAQCMSIGANAQQFLKKPVAMGGGGGVFTGWDVPESMSATQSCGTLDQYGVPATAGYTAAVDAGTVTITADPNDYADWEVTCTVTATTIQTSVGTPGTPTP